MTAVATAARKALLVATYDYRDPGLRRLVAPAHDAEALAEVLRDPAVAGFDVTVLLNQPAHVVGEAIADFYGGCRRDDLTVLYFSGHGLKDDDGRLYLAMTNTRRDALMFTGLAAAQIDEAMTACVSRRKVLILDCCYSGAFPAGHTAKADDSVNTLERFQGKGRAVLTASDSTQYSFEGENVSGTGAGSLFTRFLVEGMRSGEADLDADGDIALDELYSYVHDRVVTEMPQQRPKKQEDVDGRIVLARNVHWSLPTYLSNAIASPIAAQRRSAVDELAHLHRVGNGLVRAAVRERISALADDDSRAVSAAAVALLDRLDAETEAPPPAVAPAVAVPAPRRPAPATARPEPADEEPTPPSAAPAGPSGARVWPVLTAVVVAGVLLTASRFAVFEADNGYRESDLNWSTAAWTAEVTLPLLVALALLVRGRAGRRAPTVATGVVAGVLLTLLGEVLQWWAAFAGAGYRPGPAVWLLVGGTLVLAVGVTVAVAGRRTRQRARLRRDAVAAGAAVVIALCLLLWIFAIGTAGLSTAEWLFYKGGGLLFTVACVPLAVLQLTERGRLFGLAAVTTTGAGQVVAIVGLLIALPDGYAVPALLTAMFAVLLATGASYLGQLARRLPARR